MFTDYGKRAYIKVIELEKELDKRLKELQENSYRGLFFDLSTPETATAFTRKAKFVANADGTMRCVLTVYPPSGVSVIYEILVYSKLIKTGTVSGGETAVSFDMGVFKGENEITVKLYASIPYVLENLSLTIEGSVGEYLGNRKLSCVTHNDKNYILFVCDGWYYLYLYDGSGLNLITQKDGVIDGCIGGIINDVMYVVILNENNSFNILRYNLLTSSGFTTQSLSSGVTSVCAYPHDGGIKVLFIKSGELNIGFYDSESGFFYEKTSRRAQKVFADADAPGVYILHDEFKPVKFIV